MLNGKPKAFRNVLRHSREILRESPYSLRHDFVIPQLFLFLATGNQNLRAWMIERDEQPIVPRVNYGSVLLKCKVVLMNAFQCLECHGTQRHHDCRINHGERTLEKV